MNHETPDDDTDPDAPGAQPFVHRRVSAAGAPRLAPGVPNSAFALGGGGVDAPPTRRQRRAFDYGSAVSKVKAAGEPLSMAQLSKVLDVCKSQAHRFTVFALKAGDLRQISSGRKRFYAAGKSPSDLSAWKAAPQAAAPQRTAPPPPPPVALPEAAEAEAEADLSVGLMNTGVLLIELPDGQAMRLSRRRTRALWHYLKRLDALLSQET